MESLVSTQWLAAELGAPDLRVIDATFFLPDAGRDARAEYEAKHIPGGVFMDLDEIVDSRNPVPHMLPPEHKFASRMQSLGLGDGNRFVVYDNSPLHSAARAWWMLRIFGTHYVSILDGGLQKWKAEGRPLDAGKPAVRHGHFTASVDQSAVTDRDYVSSLVHSSEHELVDARGPGRFRGEEPEPRPGVMPGHIPGSKNLPQGQLFNPDNSWKRGDDLRAAFEAAGVDLTKPMVTTCGSGITAAVLLFGAHLLGKEDVKLYDGSWAEWGSDPSTPKSIGAA
ncbi:MAG TPA: 3-mercaptopyruvate sulfurtransferase [Allosphingosinicella sp.]|jgi:thiosulfate/3-mercaptopyruvate sulfurtransferase|nr:3-mercaptopyruvate sulfurtransferase [Allosphingosinicella sp.]